MSEDFRTICDFDTLSRPWYAEGGGTPSVRATTELARSGKASLAVDIQRFGGILRATWGADLYDVELTPESRFRFAIHGSRLLKASPGQPHGGLILVEAGGGKDGSRSHWILDIPGEFYAGGGWREFTTAPIREAHNPDWAVDADGRIDLARIESALFVLQQDDASGKQQPYTIYLDDLAALSWQPRKPTVSEAVNHSEAKHVRPVQRGFIGRKRDAGQTITFSDVTGWRVLQYGQSAASFVRSEEEPLFGEPVAKLTYRGGGGSGHVRIEPPSPVRLDEFNGILMWVFGNNWAWMPDPSTPQVLISLELKDARGETHVIDLDRVNWKFWSMMHKCVRANVKEDERHAAFGGDGNGVLDFPAHLNAIEVRGGTNAEDRTLYFDSIIFRTEKTDLPKIETKLDNLPFPTTPDTILPPLSEPVRNSIEQEGYTYRFIAGEGQDALEYVYTPKTGTLSDLSARFRGAEFMPCDGGGPLVDGEAPSVRLVSCDRSNHTVATTWRARDGLEYDLILTIKGKSLVCDWRSKGTRVTELTLGKATGLSDPKVFNVPYLTMGWGTLPGVVYNKAAYCFTVLDWYNTNASQFFGGSGWLSDSEATMNGGSRYLTLTDGSRNPLRERQFITVSHLFEEVLPSIPNPPSPFAEVCGKNLYCHVGGVELDRFQKWLEKWKLYKEYGIDHVRLSQHEDAWSDGDTVGQGPQEFTMTLDAAPEIGDKQLIDYCAEVKKLGWLMGLYSNYTDYSMLGKSWDERNVTKASNGEWRRVWPPCFNIKPLKAADMEAYYAPRVAEKFGTNTVYCDVHTCVAPWDNVDYEAGLPGAGMLSTQFRAYGALMMNERKAYGGPVFSEGSHHWFYAGLNDGNYGQMGLPEPEKQPLLVDFDLRRIHPLQADVAMIPSWIWGDGHYHMMATQIAYGHIGFLAPADDIAAVARSYYLMQQLQSRYAMVPVEAILYRAADGRMLDVSHALPEDAHRENQVYAKYKNGLEIYANCNKQKHWKVTHAGREYDLPPYGWLAAGPDFLEYSAWSDGLRRDFVDSPVYTYVDSTGGTYDFGLIETAGRLVIRKDDPRGLKLIPISTATQARLPGSYARAIAYSGDDRELSEADIEQVANSTIVRFRPDARYYTLHTR